MHEAELGAFEFDHGDAVGALARAWNMPETLASAMYAHHARADRGLSETASPKLAALVRIANTTANDFLMVETLEELSCCMDKEAWSILNEEGLQVEGAARRELMGGFITELRESPSLVI